MKKNGFTLVELAIVLMIIGLLIGGILKGQELITNARITTAVKQFRSYDAAVITFNDAYGALPGDIPNPSTRLPNCSAAGCNIAGDGNGIIGDATNWGSDENNSFWLHLAVANLVSGVNTTSTWTSANYFDIAPALSMGGNVGVIYYNTIVASYIPTSFTGHYWHSFAPSGSTNIATLKYQDIARLDTKMDDGKAVSGDVRLHTACATAGDNISYDVANTSLCKVRVKTGF